MSHSTLKSGAGPTPMTKNASRTRRGAPSTISAKGTLVEAEVIRKTKALLRIEPKVMVYNSQAELAKMYNMPNICALVMLRHGMQTDKLDVHHLTIFTDHYDRFLKTHPYALR